MDIKIEKLLESIEGKRQMIHIIDEELKNLNITYNILNKYNFDDSVKYRTEEIISKHTELKTSYIDKLNKLNKQLETQRKKCKHHLVYKCSGGHRDVYECTKCGEIIRY